MCADNASAGSGVRFALDLSRWYFEAFPLYEDRARQWLMLYYIVSEDRAEFTRRELTVMLKETILTKAYLADKLLRQLHAAKFISIRDHRSGKLIPRDAAGIEPHPIRALYKIRLGEAHDRGVDKYIGRVARYLLGRRVDIEKIMKSLRFSLMKDIYQFQKKEVHEAWGMFLKDYLANSGVAQMRKLERFVTSNAAFWHVINTLWWNTVTNSRGRVVSVSVPELHHLIFRLTGTYIKETDVRDILDMLKSGDQIVERERRGKELVYRVNSKFFWLLEQHDQRMNSLKDKFKLIFVDRVRTLEQTAQAG